MVGWFWKRRGLGYGKREDGVVADFRHLVYRMSDRIYYKSSVVINSRRGVRAFFVWRA
jgi:hypothetical protein